MGNLSEDVEEGEDEVDDVQDQKEATNARPKHLTKTWEVKSFLGEEDERRRENFEAIEEI